MIFPIGDDQVKGGYFPLFSYSFILLNIAVYIFQLQFDSRLYCSFGAIPQEIAGGQDLYTIFTSMFLHGGFGHLLGNMLFLWVFADNIEATIGNFRFLIFYLLGGTAAVLTHMYFNLPEEALFMNCCFPCDPTMVCYENLPACKGSVPLVGASGAISAVLGAYLVVFPKSKIKLLFIVFPFRLPAFIFLLFWIGEQWFYGVESLNYQSASVAWWAHIGGFMFGLLYCFWIRAQRRHRRAQAVD